MTDFYYKEQTPVVLTSAGASVATGTATSAGVVDMRSGGTSNLTQHFEAISTLKCRFTTITNIIANVEIGSLYFVPQIDPANDANDADIDTTSGSSFIPIQYRVGWFTAHKQLVTATDYRFSTAPFRLFPCKGTFYVLFRAGQTVTANWTLTLAAARRQF